jgi:hypothetical protein
MLIASAVMWAMVLAVYGWIVLRHRDQLPRLFKVFCQQGEVFIALVPTALIAAGFLTPLVPGTLVAQWLGGAAGFRGLMIGMLAGWWIPLPPIIFFSVIAVLLKSGAGLPQMISLIVAWNVFAFHRTFPLELPVMGSYFVILRLMSSVSLPLIAGGIAMLIV